MITRRTFLARSVAATAVVIAAPLMPVVAEEVPVMDVVPHFADPTLPVLNVARHVRYWVGGGYYEAFDGVPLSFEMPVKVELMTFNDED